MVPSPTTGLNRPLPGADELDAPLIDTGAMIGAVSVFKVCALANWMPMSTAAVATARDATMPMMGRRNFGMILIDLDARCLFVDESDRDFRGGKVP